MKEKFEKGEFLSYFISVREFATGIAYEINNLLFSLMAAIKHLILYKEIEAFKEELEIMKSSVRKILNIIKEIILFSEAQPDLEKKIFEIDNAVQSLIGIKNYYSENLGTSFYKIIEKIEGRNKNILGHLVFVMDSFESDWLKLVGRKGIKFIFEPFTVEEILQVI